MLKKQILIGLLSLLAINAYADLDFSAYKGKSNGGNKTDIDAYKDGIAPIKIKSPLGTSAQKNILSDLTAKYGVQAKNSNLNIIDYVLSNGTQEEKDLFKDYKKTIILNGSARNL